MSLVVMKFGGTSVEDPTAIDRTAAIVAGRVAAGKQTVVVVSAMAKVTDQFCARPPPPPRATAPALSPSAPASVPAIATPPAHSSRHPATSPRSATSIEQKFDALDEILRGLAAILELTPRISDLVVSYGEDLSSRIIAAAFRERGINAAHVDAREVIITDSQFRQSRSASTCSSRNAPPSSCAHSSMTARCR